MSVCTVATDPVGPATVARLRAAVRGCVLAPGDLGYDDARTVFNAAVDNRPQAIVAVSSDHDVATTLAIARGANRSVSVRAGGDAMAGRATAGDVVIDLSALRGVAVDAGTRTATVRAGTLWGELDAATQAHRLAVPGSRSPLTGVAGLTLCGGEGWLSRVHGLACDNLLAADLVTADGRRAVASAEQEADLFWGLRGGGVHLGVVTSLTLTLHPLDPTVLGGALLFRVSDAADVLGTLDDLHRLGHDEFAGAAAIMHAPPAAFVPGDVVGRPVLAVVPAFVGDPRAGMTFVAELRAAARPLADSVRPMSYLTLQATLKAMTPPGLRRAWAVTAVPALSPALIDDLETVATDLPGRYASVVALSTGGAVARRPADSAVALPAPGWLVGPAAQWAGPSGDSRHRAWVAALVDRLRRHDLPDSHRPGPTAAAARRLSALEAAWDPDDVFGRVTTRSRPGVSS